MMSLRRFLDAAYVLWIEEFQKHGVNLFDAIERFAGIRARTAEEPAPPSTAAQNDAALRELKAMMAGTGRV